MWLNTIHFHWTVDFELIFKVKLLEEEVAELEALEEVHEQLVESNHELELDLREELDMTLAAKRDVSFFKLAVNIILNGFRSR